jgi:hypothetical protein
MAARAAYKPTRNKWVDRGRLIVGLVIFLSPVWLAVLGLGGAWINSMLTMFAGAFLPGYIATNLGPGMFWSLAFVFVMVLVITWVFEDPTPGYRVPFPRMTDFERASAPKQERRLDPTLRRLADEANREFDLRWDGRTRAQGPRPLPRPGQRRASPRERAFFAGWLADHPPVDDSDLPF